MRKSISYIKKINMKTWVFAAIMLFTVMAVTFGFSGVPVYADSNFQSPTIMRIEAEYTGSVVEAGEKYDRKMLNVYAVYSDQSKELLEHYIVSGEVVEKEGPNTFAVIYNSLTTKFTVVGKAIKQISASCELDEVGIGNAPDARDMYVVAIYSDGTVGQIKDGITVTPDRITVPGKQEITVNYKEFQTTCSVIGVPREKLTSLTAYCDAESVMVGTPLDRNSITVMAVYSDGKAERITTYELSRSVFDEVGSQIVKVYYGDKSADFRVDVKEKVAVSMWANYTGGKVLVGRNFLKPKMQVYVSYADGTEEQVDNYTYHTGRVRYVGENIMTLYFGSTLSTTVIIEGTAIEQPTFDYVSEVSATNGKKDVKIVTALPTYLDQDSIVTRSIKKSAMKKAYKKVGVTTGDYIAFTYDFTDVDNEIELPLNVRFTIPEEFDMAHTYLYYTPNRKSIMGRVNKTVINDSVFESTLFKTGTYMLVYSEEFDRELTADEIGDEETDYLD